MPSRDFPIISADSHVNPPPLFWEEYLPKEFKDRAPKLIETEAGPLISFEGETARLNMLSSVAGTKPEEWKPNGNLKELLRQSRPSGWDPLERTKDLDHDGVWAEVLYGGGPLFSVDPQLCLATFRAYNNWLADFCSQVPERFYGLGYIPTWDVGLAVREVEHIKSSGLRGVVIPSYPHAVPSAGGGYTKLQGQADIKMAWRASNLSYSSPEFEPLWRRCVELELPVQYHLGPTLYPPGDQPVPRFSVSSTMTKLWAAGPIVDAIFGGLFERFPELTLVTSESGIGWGAFLLEYMDRNFARHRYHEKLPISERPSFYFQRNVKGAFLDDLTAIREREVIGVNSIMWGSDFPHSDGTWPTSLDTIDRHCALMSEEDSRRIFCQNAADLYSITLPVETPVSAPVA
jgi:predicted TIM-barrel fold metal-dependent hydrolase